MKIINARSDTFFIDRFTAHSGDAWCIVGSNRSGIEDFFQLVSGQDTAVTADQLELPENMVVVSFKNQQDLYESELRKDDTDFLDALDPGPSTAVQSAIFQSADPDVIVLSRT